MCSDSTATVLRGTDRRDDIANGSTGSSEGANQPVIRAPRRINRDNLGYRPIAVEDDDGFTAGRPPNQFARPIAEFADFDAGHGI